MLARVQSHILSGIDSLPCEVEVDFDNSGMDKQFVVGLPDAGVKEAIERVRSAIANAGYPFPHGRTVVNLAPADVRKEGPAYDLPIAIGLLVVQGVIPTGGGGGGSPGAPGNGDGAPDLRRYALAGELALDGRLRPIPGAIALAAMARDRKLDGVIVPADNAQEAAVVRGIDVIAARTLTEVVGILTADIQAAPTPSPDIESLLRTSAAPIDFAEVRGQESVKRALTVAAAGGHNILMLGPAGTGKTMMAKALPGVLPPLEPEEAIEITRIYSAAGQMRPGQSLITERPVRTPHHTASSAAIVGGGMIPRPGEISLAHRGILFLDELPEFPRDVLETLRQPLEDHVVTIARAQQTVRFPASFMLVAAMNPTPKGDMPAGEIGRRSMDRYLSKLSGPLLDRIDIHVEAPAVGWNQLRSAPTGTSSAHMREKALAARHRQRSRQGAALPNARLTGKQLDQHARLEPQAHTFLGQAMTELGLSARAYDKVRRVSRTIADFESADNITLAHVAEAVGYRLLDRRV